MKNLMYFIFILIGFLACNKDFEVNQSTSNSDIFVETRSIDSLILKSFIGYLHYALDSCSVCSQLEFDEDHVKSIQDNGTEQLLLVNQDGFNINNNVNLAFVAVANQNGGMYNPFFIETRKVTADLLRITYFGDKMNKLFVIELKPSSQEITFNNYLDEDDIEVEGYVTVCANYVLACMQDAYTNHGWVSVWALVQTAFIPETAAVLAADCLSHCIMDSLMIGFWFP